MKTIHTRIGKAARHANYARKKTAAIKLPGNLIGRFVVVLGRGEYRALINENHKLKRALKRVYKFMEAYQ